MYYYILHFDLLLPDNVIEHAMLIFCYLIVYLYSLDFVIKSNLKTLSKEWVHLYEDAAILFKFECITCISGTQEGVFSKDEYDIRKKGNNVIILVDSYGFMYPTNPYVLIIVQIMS
jgi:hypothetical protein